jgi:hypothetical protein
MNQQPLAIGGSECSKCHREDVAVIPKVLPRYHDTVSDIRAAAIWQTMLCKRQEPGMPETEKDTRCKGRLPGGLSSDNLVHELEQSIWVILYFHVHIKLDMLIFRLRKRGENEGGCRWGPVSRDGPASVVRLSP